MSWVIDQDQLHITIGSTPQVGDVSRPKIDLNNELGMVKAALLYAEHATLCSPVASVFAEFIDMAELTTSQKLAYLETVPAWCPGTPIADQARDLNDRYKRAWRRRYSKKGEESLRKFERAMDEMWPALSSGLREVVTKLGGKEIVSAAESGLLGIHRFKTPIGHSILDSETGSVIEEYVSVIGGTVSDKSTYPLFDEQTNTIIGSGIKAGLIPVSNFGIARSREVGLAADLFKRLPLFSQASVNEILDIRRELESALVGFRSAMLKFSKDIKDASWDDDFGLSAEVVFRQEVAPAILNIEGEVKGNRFMMELTERLAPFVTGASVLAVSMSNLPPPAVAALAIGGATVAATAIQAYRRWAEKRLKAEQNHLYFYYQAGQLLSDGTHKYRTDPNA